jgi:hypothetical protein
MFLESTPLRLFVSTVLALGTVCAGTAPSPAAAPAGWGMAAQPAADAEPGTSEGPSPDERKAFEQIESAFLSNDYEKVIVLAKDFVRSAKDESLKTAAAAMVAKAQRRKKEWDLAQGAYLSLRDRYPKGSDEYARAEAVAEILRASREGVYHPLTAAGGEESGGTLDDDAVLEKALACLAQERAKRLELRVPRLRRARNVEGLVQQFLALAEEMSQLRGISPEMSPNLERQVVQTAAMRLKPLAERTIAALKEKTLYYKAMLEKRGLTSSRRSEMLQYKAMCENLLAAERAFLDGVDKLEGTRDWPEGQSLKEEGVERCRAYKELVKTFTPPELPDRGSRGSDWTGRTRDGNRW